MTVVLVHEKTWCFMQRSTQKEPPALPWPIIHSFKPQGNFLWSSTRYSVDRNHTGHTSVFICSLKCFSQLYSTWGLSYISYGPIWSTSVKCFACCIALHTPFMSYATECLFEINETLLLSLLFMASTSSFLKPVNTAQQHCWKGTPFRDHFSKHVSKPRSFGISHYTSHSSLKFQTACSPRPNKWICITVKPGNLTIFYKRLLQQSTAPALFRSAQSGPNIKV